MNGPAGVRAFLEDLFARAVAAAHPATCLPRHLPAPPRDGQLILLAAGKAAGSMIEVAEQHYLDTLKFPAHRMSGIAVARHGYGRPTRVIPMVEAGHPVPDAAGLESAASALEHAEGATADDLVLVLMSGGASANWIAPAGITFAEKQAVTRALLRSGANIGEINTVRKHLSHIKGGRLARAAASGARGDARGLGRAGRRSGGDRLRPDRARSLDARRRPRDRCALQARPARRGRARAQRSRRTKARSPAMRRSPDANSI